MCLPEWCWSSLSDAPIGQSPQGIDVHSNDKQNVDPSIVYSLKEVERYTQPMGGHFDWAVKWLQNLLPDRTIHSIKVSHGRLCIRGHTCWCFRFWRAFQVVILNNFSADGPIWLIQSTGERWSLAALGCKHAGGTLSELGDLQGRLWCSVTVC